MARASYTQGSVLRSIPLRSLTGSGQVTPGLPACLFLDDAELKMGSSEKTILNYFHPDAVELFNITSNLRRVCQELKDPTTTLSARVALCSRPDTAARHSSVTPLAVCVRWCACRAMRVVGCWPISTGQADAGCTQGPGERGEAHGGPAVCHRKQV